MATDLGLSSAAQLLALINADNNTTLELGDVTFNPPTVVDGTLTQVKVVAVPNSGYLGFVDVEYDRLDLNGFNTLNGGPVQLYLTATEGFSDLISRFNTHFGANLQIGTDVTDQVISQPVDEPVNVTLTAVDESLAYVGQLTLSYALSTIPLANIITNNILFGLRYDMNLGPVVATTQLQRANTPNASFEYGDAAIIDGIAYVVAGHINGGLSTTIYRFDIANNVFLSNLTFPAAANQNPTVIAHDGVLYVFTTASAHYKYTVSTNTWTKLANSVNARNYGRASVVANEIYLFARGASSNSFEKYSIASNTWTTLANTPFNTTQGLLNIHIDGKLYCLARYHTDPTTTYGGRVFIYDIETNTWTYEALDNEANLRFNSVDIRGVEVNGYGYVVSTLGTGYLDVSEMKIKSWPIAQVTQRYAIATDGDFIYLFGGTSDPNGVYRFG